MISRWSPGIHVECNGVVCCLYFAIPGLFAVCQHLGSSERRRFITDVYLSDWQRDATHSLLFEDCLSLAWLRNVRSAVVISLLPGLIQMKGLTLSHNNKSPGSAVTL